MRGPQLHLLPHRTDEPESRRSPDPRWFALLILLGTLLLVVGGVLLVRKLSRVGRLQDCIMSGRTNCAPIDPSAVGGG